MHLTIRPTDSLRPYVAAYTGFDLSGLPPGVHLGLPGRALNLVISLSGHLEITSPSVPLVRRVRVPAMAGGLTSRSIAIHHGGRQHGVRITLTPAGSRAILGMPAAALAHEVVGLDEVLGGLGTEVVERLHASSTWADRGRVLDAVLLRRLALTDGGAARAEVAEMWRRLVHHRGRMQIGALAADLGWSHRHLSDRFRAEFGMPPKTVARVLRIEHAAELAASGHRRSWADIAANAGYADQAHLVREWRAMVGCTPTAWRRHDAMAAPPA